MKYPKQLTITEWLILIGILLAALGVRVMALETIPPPLNVDEAVHAYDAYSLLRTGADEWGQRWPILMRAFNDYRRPATTYSAIPFIAVFNLSVFGIRAMAAFWGWLSVLLLYRLARDMFGRPTGITAALLLALSPWHIAFSRLGVEVSGPLLPAILAGLDCGWRWTQGGRSRWLYASSVAFAVGWYSYTTAQAFIPLLLGGCGLVFFPRFRREWRQTLPAALLMLALIAPATYATISNPFAANRMQAVSLFTRLPLTEAVPLILKQWLGHFSPRYLFLRGDAQPIHHPQGFGQLYWIEAPLILLGLLAIIKGRYDRKAGILLLIWLAVGAIPAALTWQDMGSANAMRSLVNAPGWALLSSLGASGLITTRRLPRPFQAALLGLLLGAFAWNVQLVLNDYFTRYPIRSARDFEYGIQEAMHYVTAHEEEFDTIVLTDWISQPHIFAVIFQQYDPAAFQQTHAPYGDRLSEKLAYWGGRYRTGDAEALYAELPHGLFVVRPHMLPDVTPELVIFHPDGSPAFKIIIK